MPTSNPTTAPVGSCLAAVLVALPLALLSGGCASAEEASAEDAAEDDLTSATHGKMVQKCLDTAAAAIHGAPTSVTAARASAKTCLAAANDRVARPLDARRSRTAQPAATAMSAYRKMAEAACGAYVDSVSQAGIDAAGLKSNCGYHVEYAIARLVQTYGELGGPPYATLWGIRRNEQAACYSEFEGNVSKIRTCVERGVEQTILDASPQSLSKTVKTINDGNVSLCAVMIQRRTKAATEAANDECRIEAAIFLQQLEALQPH